MSGRQKVKFNLSEKNEMLRDLVQLSKSVHDEDGNEIGCDHVSEHYSRDDLDKFSDRLSGDRHFDEESSEQMCRRIVHDYAPRPIVHLDKELKPGNAVFQPNFLHFVYIPNSTDKVVSRTAAPTATSTSISSSPRSSHKSIFSSFQEFIKTKVNGGYGGQAKPESGPPNQWEEALKDMDGEEKWVNKIYNQLHILGETETGDMILRLIATLFLPGEIKVTNKNPSQLSANVFTNEVNIPSAPRYICYYDPKNNLIPSQTWMALGHELIHLIHAKLGIHDINNSNNEEENTVQGLISGGADVGSTHPYPLMASDGGDNDNDYDEKYKRKYSLSGGKGVKRSQSQHPLDHSMIEDVDGKDWILTENQFRKEHHIPYRNGYDSIPVCSIFEKSGCDLYNDYGDDTCMVLQTEPSMKNRLDTLIGHKKH
jgi:hypothetical protein